MVKKTTPYALLSVFDKTDIVLIAKELIKLGYAIVSTGGTAKVLSAANIPVTPIQKITGNPESFDGRMKTISFQVESGILYDRAKKKHREEARTYHIPDIAIVICNLYPFEQTIQKKSVTLPEVIESIDVGGPTMIRAGAKNFAHVFVVVDPHDYSDLIKTLKEKKGNVEIRQQFAAKAFAHLSFYDSQIARYLRSDPFPDEITLPGRKTRELRYGENPHQKAAVYIDPQKKSPLSQLKKEWGRDLSLTNVSDINAGIEAVRNFASPAAVVIKHNNPCGIALGSSPSDALKRAIAADPESAFGGVIVTNKAMDEKVAKIIGSFKEERRGNIDITAVPTITPEALTYLSNVRKTMGIYTFSGMTKPEEFDMNIKWIDGGFILQTTDANIEDSFANWRVVTKVTPTKIQRKQMEIGWLFISRIRSNAILVIDKTLPMTRGIGTGQTSRIRSAQIALQQAKEYTKGGILISDSFFPFDDTVKLANKYGIAAIVQQGGSINDNASIAAADKAGIPMVFTNRRAFWH